MDYGNERELKIGRRYNELSSILKHIIRERCRGRFKRNMQKAREEEYDVAVDVRKIQSKETKDTTREGT